MAACVPGHELVPTISEDIPVYDLESAQSSEDIRTHSTELPGKRSLVERDFATGVADRAPQATLLKATNLLFRYPLVAKKLEIRRDNPRAQ